MYLNDPKTEYNSREIGSRSGSAITFVNWFEGHDSKAFEKRVVISLWKHFRWFGAFPVLRQDTYLDSPLFQSGGHAEIPLFAWLWDHWWEQRQGSRGRRRLWQNQHYWHIHRTFFLLHRLLAHRWGVQLLVVEPAKLSTYLMKGTVYLPMNDVGLGQCCLHQPINLIMQLIPKEIQDPGTQ